MTSSIPQDLPAVSDSSFEDGHKGRMFIYIIEVNMRSCTVIQGKKDCFRAILLTSFLYKKSSVEQVEENENIS
jgi:hypothetical protein